MDPMSNTYEMIRALPGKGTNWTALVAALTNNYLSVYAEKNGGQTPWKRNTIDVWNAAKGVRELRTAAMEAANFAVSEMSQRSTFQSPSPETLAWGGFLGGSTLVWTDDDAEAQATVKIAAIIASAK